MNEPQKVVKLTPLILKTTACESTRASVVADLAIEDDERGAKLFNELISDNHKVKPPQ